MITENNYPIFDLQDIFSLDTIDEFREKNFDHYFYHELGVPRVSIILKECINREFLLFWAAKIGTQEMMKQKKEATTIGSKVHEMIEHYLTTSEDLDLKVDYLPYKYMEQIETAYNNFKLWLNKLNSLGYYIEEVIAIEKQIVCPYYGGTIDLVCRINGKVYILDFKTSKKITYDYILQTISYMWIVNNGYTDLPHIDGVGIVRIDKYSDNTFEELFLNENDPNQKYMIDQYIIGFGSLLSAYYNNINMNTLFNRYKKVYNIEEVL